MIDVYKFDYKKVKVKCFGVEQFFIGKAVADTEYESDRDYIIVTKNSKDKYAHILFADEIESIEEIEG